MFTRKKRLATTKAKMLKKRIKLSQVPTGKQAYLKNLGLRKTFSKVKTGASPNGTDDNIYEIKDTTTIPINLKDEVTVEKPKDINVSSQIPGLTDEDMNEIIKISDLEKLFESTYDEFNASCDSTLKANIDSTLSTPHATHSSPSLNVTCDSTLLSDFGFPTFPNNSIVQQHHDDPLDLSIKNVEVPQSTLMTSNSPNIPLSTTLIPLTPSHKPNDNSRCVMQHNYKIPMAHSTFFTKPIPKSTQAIQKPNFADMRCSSSPSSTTTTYFNTNTNIMGIAAASGQENKRQPVQELAMMPSMILNEIAGLQGIKPTYELLPIGEASYFSPIYRYRVSFKNQQDYGSGKSMEDAKNSAASALLDKLTGNNYFGNVIGCLQEVCMARHWPLPKYEHVLEIPTIEGRVFITSCTVLETTEFGQAKNKKNAKLFAAYKVWMKISHR